MRIPELLAPAGNAVALHAAVCAGADAVYLGLGSFNARINADNFTFETFEEACDYAHLRGVKIYVTMNTVILPEELDEALACAAQAYDRGADGLIVQDLGLAARVRRSVPDLDLHISTQMNIHNRYGLEAAAALGAMRVTLARELSVPEITRLCTQARDLGLEIETFAHGALCVCYSGQCLMSSMIGGRSANRGRCAQACRLPYELTETLSPEKPLRAPGEFLLSPKDLCSVDLVSDLARVGVASLKIEGRMKSPEYVQSVVSVYRAVLDRLAAEQGRLEGDEGSQKRTDSRKKRSSGSAAPTPEERERLASVFSRGFTTAYLEGIRTNEMMSYQRPNNRGQFVGRVKSIKDGVAHIQSEVTLEPGDLVEFWTRRGNVTLSVPADLEQGRKTAYLPLEGLGKDAESVRVQDRVFRVRAASAAFHDDANEPRIPVAGSIIIRIGEPLRMDVWVDPASDSVGHEPPVAVASAEGPVVEPARSRPLNQEDVYAHVDRMGSTPFYLTDLQIDLSEDAGLGFSQIHHVRAAALERLQKAMLAPYQSRLCATACANGRSHAKTPHRSLNDLTSEDFTIAVLATNPDTARAAKRAGAEAIYVPALNYRRGQSETAGALDRDVRQAGFPKGCVPVMPVVDHDLLTDDLHETLAEAGEHVTESELEAIGEFVHKAESHIPPNRESMIEGDAWDYVSAHEPVLVDSLGTLQRALEEEAVPEIGQHLPLVNAAALEVAHAYGATRVWLSPELNMHQIRDLGSDTPLSLGIKIAGAQELMVTEHCLLMSQGPCNEECPHCARRKVPHALKDRKGYLFPVVTDMYGRSHLYNGVELDMVNALPELAEAGVTSFMIDATLMDAEQTAHATGRLAKAIASLLEGAEPLPKLPNTTSGHLFRGVS